MPSPITSEAQARIRESLARDRWIKAGIPLRFQGVSFDELDPTPQLVACREYARNIRENVRRGLGLILKGAVGTGKTTAACAIAKAASDAGITVHLVRPYRLVDDLDTYRGFGDTEGFRNLERRLKDAGLLILDDFGLERFESWAEQKVESIISDRYDECRATVITTNLANDDLRDKYRERILDRLKATCAVVTFSGASRRVNLGGAS